MIWRMTLTLSVETRSGSTCIWRREKSHDTPENQKQRHNWRQNNCICCTQKAAVISSFFRTSTIRSWYAIRMNNLGRIDLTLQSISPGDNSSKGCLEKQREQAKRAVDAAELIFDWYLYKRGRIFNLIYNGKTILINTNNAKIQKTSKIIMTKWMTKRITPWQT